MDRVVLVSDPTPEFPRNSPDAFHVRLAEPMTLEGNWEVALTSLSIPDGGRNLEKIPGSRDDALFKVTFTLLDSLRNEKIYTYRVTSGLVEKELYIKQGMDLMKSLLTLNVKHVNAVAQNLDLRMSDKRRPTFQWNGGDFIMDAKLMENIRPLSGKDDLGVGFSVNADLAVGMGWLTPDKLRLGKNLYYQLKDKKASLNTEVTQRDLWMLEEENKFMRLSMTVNWIFTNLNEAFADFIGSPSRRFFVYTDLVESNRMGGQRHPLIREVYFPKNGEGIQYFEPLHLQWMPLRRPWIDTIQVQLADPTGTLAKFQGGQTVVTFSFRKGTV